MRPVRNYLLLALVALVAFMTAACSENRTPVAAGAQGIKVLTTVSPITSVVAAILGPGFDIEGIVPEGTNSHTFEPPPRVAKILEQADVVFINGLKLEEPTKELALKNKKAGAVLVELGDRSITPAEYKYDFSFPRDGGKPNPHLWTNPQLVKRYAEIVKDTMSAKLPEEAARFDANYQGFVGLVDDFDRAMRTSFATIDPAKRKLLTYHDAYAYFADAYGFTVIGAIQPSDFEDPTPKEVADLITQIRREQVPAIFGSEVFPSPVLEQIGKEAGVRYVDKLRDDDLPGKPGDREHSWLGLMRFNFVTITEALGGDAAALKAFTVPGYSDTAVYPQ